MASRTIARMDSQRAQRRELVILALAVIAPSRLLEGSLIWLAAGLLALALVAGTATIIGDGNPAEASIESVILPALAAFACVGAIRLIPLGYLLVPAVIVAWLLIDRVLAFEIRIGRRAVEPTDDDRTTALGYAVVIAFLAFAGIAAFIAGGLVEPVVGQLSPISGQLGTVPLSERELVALALADAFIGALLGFRVSVLRERSVRDALWSAATYAAVVAIAAAAVRATALPRLLAPALLALVFYVWDGVHGAPPDRRRDPRWIWQTALLVVLGAAVLAWNLALRG